MNASWKTKKLIEYLLYSVVLITAWPASNSEPWSEVSRQIVIVIAVITAAVFVRLNRALPKMDAAFFRFGQIKRVSDSYVATSKEMAFFARTIILVLGYGILGLKPLEVLVNECSRIEFLPRYILCVSFGYVLVRSLKLVTLDLDFMRLQAEIMLCEAEKKSGEQTQSSDETVR